MVKLMPTLPANIRGVQIVEQEDGKYSLYTETGPWSKLQDETLLGKDLSEDAVFEMVDSFDIPIDTPKKAKPATPAAAKRKVVWPKKPAPAKS